MQNMYTYKYTHTHTHDLSINFLAHILKTLGLAMLQEIRFALTFTRVLEDGPAITTWTALLEDRSSIPNIYIR